MANGRYGPAIDRDIHALFLQIADSDPAAFHVIVWNQASLHLPTDDPRLYPSLRKLEVHLAAVARHWCQPAQIHGLIRHWLSEQTYEQTNSGVPT